LFADTPCGDPAFLWHVDVFPEDLIPEDRCKISIKPLRPGKYYPAAPCHYFLLKDRRDVFIRHVYQACTGPQYREHYCTTIHVDDLPDVESLQYIALEAE
jgi:hypothetical protein